MSHFVIGWYVMYTKPRHEHKVARQLSEKNIPHFLPTTKETGTGKNVILIKEMPLYPSYVFVFIDGPSGYYNSINVNGYCSYVSFGNKIATVSNDVINKIRLITERGRHIEIMHVGLPQGQKALITKGPLAGIGCQVVRHKQKNVTVTVDLLGKIVTAVVARQHLAVV
ncbi:transcription termination/antitermination protein NusG [Chitinophaga sancti]|uniref:Transcription antitermination factor NusG n=1 Tax=Chitinophaga sancti TaxID=1004 RepID=A0A1K1LUL2_9BACT|nr:transcription termination/antitermination NusG family protein [Chitinophaga sancti]WQD64911.1 transcription termination/antitermination NusG family protein [Chitinophaga sancti]WQG89465.1 transcription termination/antitermination NusG family protein [Chitinophaga sancti]SFW13350.1 Transcription antitermination factor NusG [Chitinophaga sancti]